MNAQQADDDYFSREPTPVEEAQSHYSDFHKERYGFRPRTMSTENWNSLEWLNGRIKDMHDSMERMKETFAGRESLREEGWHVEETDPVLLQQAVWLKQERDRAQNEHEAQWAGRTR